MLTLLGKVIDQITRNPIAEAKLMLQKEEGSSTDIAQITDAHGGFSYNALDPGTYSLQVHAEAYKTQIRRLEIGQDTIYKILIQMDKK